ncbi:MULTISPECIES: MBL fold metallo-hydrolase [Kocuria]|jgi:glyoxylase-like metal-dependent hydrolase (beta-lactamase superfamily II)|uniref:MBL fold metallo-hydrolase n=1 Tax=Kocuria TaxID=57493 RepID=UPI00203D0043|nr:MULTISPECIES: MBL fold metallo-hydrolase [Kocuria]MCM3688104.1 MBL fold metallo-hydrolase [Kocuria rosea]HST71366.1 MBL fold metallo-hydrolase [Kocuria rosea]
MFTSGVADGVHLITHAHVNCYLVEDEDGLTLVDAGLPSMWPMLLAGLEELGRRPEDVKALVLTHGHFDHVGFARRAQDEWGLPVLGHPADARLAAHPYRYRPQRNRFLYPLGHPRSLPLLGRMALAGALSVKGVRVLRPLETGSPLPVPGRPVVVHTPGHTDGHCVLDLPGRGTVLSGDALVTLDPYTGRRGPQIVASAATSDTATALASLDAVAATGARTVLPGHGEPWAEGAEAAVRHALAVGAH